MKDARSPVRLHYDTAVVSPSGLAVTELSQVSALASTPFSCALFTVPQGVTTELDQHEVVEMWIVHQGVGMLFSDGEEFTVKAGDAFLLPGQVPHQVHNTGGELLEIFSIWWRRQG